MKTFLSYYTSMILLHIALFSFIYGTASGNSNNIQQLNKNKSSHFFIENKGQWPSEVLFLARLNGLDAWITKGGIKYNFYRISAPANIQGLYEPYEPPKNHIADGKIEGHNIFIAYKNINGAQRYSTYKQESFYYNYFIGNDASKWASHVKLFQEVVINDLYKGIDLRYYYDQGRLRYDYILKPGADPSQITFTIEGSDKTIIKNNTEIQFETTLGRLRIKDLKVFYDDGTPIKSSFKKTSKGLWAIELKDYDKKRLVIIDPLVYSTYIGGGNYERGNSIMVTGTDNAIISGYTESSTYPVTSGAYQTSFHGNLDIMVSKLNASGSSLVFSTFIGGSSYDYNMQITMDSSDNIYITGLTSSTNFPTTTGAVQTSYGGGRFDAIVTKLNSSGSALVFSTYIGGSDEDRCYDITLDDSSNIYITGISKSTNYPVTSGAYQSSNSGYYDCIFSKLNSSATTLLYSTYLGGSNYDLGNSVDVDASGNMYVGGHTRSTNFPTSSGAFQTSNAGYADSFISKLNASGSSLIYSTYIGGSGPDYIFKMSLDNTNNVIFSGDSYSSDYPVTSGAYQTSFGGNRDIVVGKLNSTGTALVFATYIGGSNYDYQYGFTLDANYNPIISGYTNSTNYPVTSNAYQSTLNSNLDVFISTLNSTGTSLTYSSYIGGSQYDKSYGVAIDNSDNIYLTGSTNSSDYPTTSGAYQTSNAGDYDAFITKLDTSISDGGGATPIDLLFFKAQQVNNEVVLKWATASETNNNYFIISKSKDKTAWQELSKVKGAGNSNLKRTYQDIDSEPFDGPTYYRLSQVDYDGTVNIASTVFIEVNIDNAKAFSISPNPVEKGKYLRITLDGFEKEKIIVKIQDLLGRKYFLNQYNINQNNETIELDLSNILHRGFYIVSVTHHNKSYTQIIVVK